MAQENPPVLTGPALWSAQAHLPSVLGRQLTIERAEGSYLFSTDGRRLFDGTAACGTPMSATHAPNSPTPPTTRCGAWRRTTCSAAT